MITLQKKHKIKFGNWIADRKFHLKKFYVDAFRGQSCVGYKLVEQCYQNLPAGHQRPWQDESYTGLLRPELEGSALAHPDGFPVWVRQNGVDRGLYALCLRKCNDNYLLDDEMNTEGQTHIMLDGEFADDSFWVTDVKKIDWSMFEVRCPGGLFQYNQDGEVEPYDGDHPSELVESPTKTAIENLATTVASLSSSADLVRNLKAGKIAETEEVASEINQAKELFTSVFDLNYFIDYFLISQVLWHYDGFRKNWIWITYDGKKWFVTFYDLDSIFGMVASGIGVSVESETRGIIPGSMNIHKPSGQLWWLFQEEVKSRYRKLRENGLFSVGNIMRLLHEWRGVIGEEYYEAEFQENLCPETPSHRANNIPGVWSLWNGYIDGNVKGTEFKLGNSYTKGDFVYARTSQKPQQQITLKALSSFVATSTEDPFGGKAYINRPWYGGFYNTEERVRQWLIHHFELLDADMDFDSSSIPSSARWTVENDEDQKELYYDPLGRSHNGLRRGLNIVRKADGSVQKMVVK